MATLASVSEMIFQNEGALEVVHVFGEVLQEMLADNTPAEDIVKTMAKLIVVTHGGLHEMLDNLAERFVAIQAEIAELPKFDD